jgi:DNA-directed RNA polymerase specialized sigma24 family protein
VEVLNAYPHTFPLVKALRSDLSNHTKPDTKSQECGTGSKSSVRTEPRPLRKRLAPKDRQRLIAEYLDGALQKELATEYDISLSSVKTILREVGAKKYVARA